MNIQRLLLSVIYCLTIAAGFSSEATLNGDMLLRQDTVRIGLLVESLGDKAAIDGAKLAISAANSVFAGKGKYFELVVRSMEGPWGTGSKEAVSLVFEDKVAAIAGSCYGRNGHLAEQVSAKSKVVMVSARATEQTLNQAFVPWYFNVVPGDNQQADIIYRQVFSKKDSNPVVLAEDTFDTKKAAESFIARIKKEGITPPELFTFKSTEKDIQMAANLIKSSKGPVALYCLPQTMKSISAIAGKVMEARRIYAPLLIHDEDIIRISELKKLEGIITVSSGYWKTARGLQFIGNFKKTYGYEPGTKAAYAYDAVSILTESIIRAGKEYDKLQKAISAGAFDGVTGKILFDEHGNRIAAPELMQVKDGIIKEYR